MNPLPILLASELLLPLAAGPGPLPPLDPTAIIAAAPATAEASETADAAEDKVDFRGLKSGRPHVARALPTLAELATLGAVIGEIRVSSGDIFDAEDPKENYRLYMLANRLHRATRERVIRRHLLFGTGDKVNPYRLEESERILRSQRYLYDAEIRPIAWDGRKVDLEVVTRDVWTLKIGASVSRSGGANDTEFTLQDSNFLGTGKELTLKQSSDVDRTGYLVRYFDPNLAGTRAELEMLYADNSDGSYKKLAFERPFYSLEARRAAGIEFRSNDRVDTFYRLSEVSHEFHHEETFLEVWTGFSTGLQGDETHRWLGGVTYDHDRFSAVTDRPVLQPPFAEREVTYPWIGFETVENRFLKTHDLNLIGRTEDIEVGRRMGIRVGYSSSLFGANQDGVILRGHYSTGLQPAPRHLLFFDGNVSGRLADRTENLVAGLRARYYWRNFGPHAFYATFELDAAENLDPERQLLLGGDTGLRGYPLRYQEGERRALVTLEQRFYTNWHPFRLAYLGAAVFFDAGKAWNPGILRNSDRGILTNAGLGLRISPSRSGFGSMIHLDVAFPLDAPSDVDKVQWLVSTKETF